MTDLPVQTEMAQSALPGAGEGCAAAGIEDAKLAVSRFLQRQFDVKHAQITRLAPITAGKGGWEAEAEINVPNATIKALKLPVRRQVLDRQLYALRLDDKLNIVAYELKGSVVEGEA